RQGQIARTLARGAVVPCRIRVTVAVTLSIKPRQAAMHPDVAAYHEAQSPDDRTLCERLHQEIDRALPDASSKDWHGHPVWFLDGNPIVGYGRVKTSVRLLFWSGQSFDEPDLIPEGTFKAAEARYTAIGQVDGEALQRWLAKARTIQWDYKNVAKRRG